MNRLEAWLMHVSNVIVALTGFVYAVMHYMMKPADPFSVVNHPLEPYMLKSHILAAPILIFTIALIVHGHILLKLVNGARSGRKSGILMIPMFAVMALSGYVLQVLTATSVHQVCVVIHLSSGAIWFGGYCVHQVAAIRMKRAMALRNHG